MSEDRHADLDDLYDQLLTAEDIIEEDDLDDGDYELYIDAQDMDEEMGGDEDEEDDDDYDEEYDDGDPDVYFEDEEDDDDDAGEGGGGESGGIEEANLQRLAALFNNAPNAEARSSLLARLLAGTGTIETGPATRSGPAGILRRLGTGLGMVSAEERARAAAERRRREKWWSPQMAPHPKGAELLRGGEFGKVGDWRAKGRRRVAPRRVWPGRRFRSWVPPIAQVSKGCSPLHCIHSRP